MSRPNLYFAGLVQKDRCHQQLCILCLRDYLVAFWPLVVKRRMDARLEVRGSDMSLRGTSNLTTARIGPRQVSATTENHKHRGG
jgi:hypothetical protein